MFAFGYTNLIVNIVIVLIILLNIIVYKLQQLQEAKFAEQINQLSSSVGQICRCFSLFEIKQATKNFHDELVIGQGGFGKVYKGVIDFGATMVAMKRSNSESKQGSKEFRTEIEMLSKFRHSNVVSLIGYCDQCNEMILVYEYMPCGTLADHLHKQKRAKKGNTGHLSWEKRIKICIGAARGLDYLHTGTGVQHRVIHRDVKSTNILLDENMEARISDFGMSKMGPANQGSTYVSTHLKGSFGYMDPYYFSTRTLTRKSDVYSLGVVLFEVLCGRPAVDSSLDEEQIGLAGWAQHCFEEGLLDQIIDPSIKGKILPNSLMAFVKIAIQCLHNRPKKRPSMAEIVVSLESVLALQESIPYILVERPITSHNQENVHFSMVEVENANHNQENRNSSTQEGMINGGHHSEQFLRKSARKTFSKKVRQFVSITTRVFSVGAAKPSRNSKISKSNVLQVKREGYVHDVRVPTVTANLKVFTLTELRGATRNFQPAMRLGQGGFGTVFKGWVHENTYAPSKLDVGMAIAVKRLHVDGFQGHKEWLAELALLGEYKHPNLVKLLGYCMEDKERLLVYEYMQKGSLDTHLFKSAERLPWVTRLNILIGAARGIDFLHTAEIPVIFRDLKASNILLDGEFNAKLSDFGLAKLDPVNGNTHVSTVIAGTYGYAAPEYVATGHLTSKSDIYAFGVVLLELLTGRQVMFDTGGGNRQSLVAWAKPLLNNKTKVKKIVLDPWLKFNFPDVAIRPISSLILQCVDTSPKNRPSMVQVVETLEQIATMS